MAARYQIHPSIGVARLGNAPDEFCIAPEAPGGMPIDCGADGNPKGHADGDGKEFHFKDCQGRIKRQAARFQVFVHDDEHPEGRPLRFDDKIEGGGNVGTLQGIQWRVYLANKKSVWYTFQQLQGEHGYSPSHALRNPNVVDEESRQKLIIDPGPRAVGVINPHIDPKLPDTSSLQDERTAHFSRDCSRDYAPTFPPPLSPRNITTLGELKGDDEGRLLVLGGYGNSGSCRTGLGEPRITEYANNDGWFDDTSDGPVMARLMFYVEDIDRYRFIDVEGPAWVIVGYPSYVPQILDLVTMDDVLYDVGIRQFATNTCMFGTPPFGQHVDSNDPAALAYWEAQELRYNPEYTPWFNRDVWPILNRPYTYTWLTQVLYGSNFPHDQSSRGTFFKQILGQVPCTIKDPEQRQRADDARFYLFNVLRQPGEENQFRETGRPNSRTHSTPLMPLLAGDNPISNDSPSKFLRLTNTQLFILKQWAAGKFINEEQEWGVTPAAPTMTGEALDHGVLSNILGGAFCPGGEAGWVMRNPSIYRAPYKIKADPNFYNFDQTPANAYYKPNLEYAYLQKVSLSQGDNFETGLQPGDITKHMALPWQADFNECSTQTIDITYEDFNRIYPNTPADPRTKIAQRSWETLWWPAHRPMQVFIVRAFEKDEQPAGYSFVDWAKGIPGTSEGDLKMVTSWSELGFVIANPYFQPYDGNPNNPHPPWEDPGGNPRYIAVEAANLPIVKPPASKPESKEE